MIIVLFCILKIYLHHLDLYHLDQLIEAAEENRRPFGTQLFPFRTVAMILSMISLVLVSKIMVRKMLLAEICRSLFSGLVIQKWQTYKGAGLLQMHRKH